MAGAQLQDESEAGFGTRADGDSVSASAARGSAAAARGSLQQAGDLVVYGALRALWTLLKKLPPERARGVLEGAGALIGRVDRHHRRVVAANLALAFPDWNERARDQVIDASFRNWGRLAAEAIHFRAVVRSATEGPWREAAERAAAAGGEGRGLLVLTAHSGNFEILARTWGARIGPLAVFHRNLGNPYVDGFLRAQRLKVRMTTIGRGESVRDALRLLQGGTSIAVALDQNQRPGHGTFVDMFGRPASTSTILARLSLATKTPVLPVFAAWESSEGGQTIPVIGAPILPPPGRSVGEARAQAILELTQRYTSEIEAMVRRYPDQWNWAHRRWKTRPDGERAE